MIQKTFGFGCTTFFWIMKYDDVVSMTISIDQYKTVIIIIGWLIRLNNGSLGFRWSGGILLYTIIELLYNFVCDKNTEKFIMLISHPDKHNLILIRRSNLGKAKILGCAFLRRRRKILRTKKVAHFWTLNFRAFSLKLRVFAREAQNFGSY